MKTLSLKTPYRPTYITCPQCHGDGGGDYPNCHIDSDGEEHLDYVWEDCEYCDGDGKVYGAVYFPYDDAPEELMNF
jgi:hypothetical protein